MNRTRSESNQAHEIERRLETDQLHLLLRASRMAADRRVGLFLVGGSVRDTLLGNGPADLDLVVEGSSADFAPALASELGGEVVASSQFGTHKLRLGGVVVDLAMARNESYARPGALPDVSPGSMREDLARRDFSVNAMAISLGRDAWGDLLDPFQGKADLQRRVIRILRPDSFVDDATRILRAVRYAHRLGFALEEETRRLIKRDLHHLDAIGGDRIRHDLERMFREPGAASMLEAAQELGVLAAVHPAFGIGAPLASRLRGLPVEPPDSDLRFLAALVFPAASGEVSSVIARLSMDGRWTRVARDAASIKADSHRLGAKRVRRSLVYSLLRRRDAAAIEGCALATEEPLVRQRLDLYMTELRHVRPLLRGDDLLALGVPEGPLVGELLERLLTARLEGLLSTRKDEEDLVVRTLEGSRR